MTTAVPPEAERSFTGLMHTLNETGDTRVMWDKTQRDEVETAEAQFNSLTKKGYAAFHVTGKGNKGDRMTRFDPEAERILLVPPLQGG